MQPQARLKVILIETHNSCNRNCWFCMYGQTKYISLKQAPKEMSWDTISKVVSNLKSLDFRGRISWFRINEPLLEKRMCEILEFTRKQIPHCYLTLTTNGGFWDQYTYDRLIESGLNHLTISVYDDRTFEKVTRMNMLDNVRIKDRRSEYKWENRGGNITRLKKYKAEGICLRPSTALNVTTTGDVVLCCADFYSDVVMGNVNEQSIEDIWYGKRFQSYREGLIISRKGLQLCENCSHDGRGHEVILPVGVS